MADEASESQCILVVDGDVLVRLAISGYLRHCGYDVLEAATTDEAGTILDETKLSVDAVLCDAEAPGSRNAFQFRQWARERHQVQIALAGSISAAAEKAAELCENGPQLRRPYDPQGVVDYIKRLLGSGASTPQNTGKS